MNVSLDLSQAEFNLVLITYSYYGVPGNVSPVHVTEIGDIAVYPLLLTVKLRMTGQFAKESALHTKEGYYKRRLLQHQLSFTL